jgi:ribosomal protein L37AE/L43A
MKKHKTAIRFEDKFPSEKDCREYLFMLRYPDGYFCSKCEQTAFWRNQRDVLICRNCRNETTLTSGSFLQNSRLPLKTIFHIFWIIAESTYGMNAKDLQRECKLKNYLTARNWLTFIRKQLYLESDQTLGNSILVDHILLKLPVEYKYGLNKRLQPRIVIAVSAKFEDKANFRIRLIRSPSVKATNEFIRSCLPGKGVIHIPDKQWFYSDERQYYKRKFVKQECEFNGQAMIREVSDIAILFNHWLKSVYQNHIRISSLSSYVQEFEFWHNRNPELRGIKLFELLLERALSEIKI